MTPSFHSVEPPTRRPNRSAVGGSKLLPDKPASVEVVYVP